MRVFVSSTFKDFADYRAAARRAILRAGFEPVLIEELWGTTNPSGGIDVVTSMLENAISECDVFVQILGFSIGAIAPGLGKPWIVIETELATRKGKRILVYIVEPRFENGIQSERIAAGFSSNIVRAVYSPDAFSIALRRDLSAIAEKREPSDPAYSIILPSIDPSDFKSLVSNPEELRKASPRFFEEVVAELLKADGWDVKLVLRPNSPGPDIIAISSKVVGNLPLKMVVECKRWRADRPVNIDVVRKVMYWVNEEYRTTFGMIATTSHFTSNAIAQTEDLHQWRLTLRDYDEIIRWIARHIPV